MSLRDLSVKAKLSFSFGLMGLFLLTVVVMAIGTLSSQHQRFQVYVDQTSLRLRQANELLDAANARAIAARNLVLGTKDEDRQMESAKVKKADEDVVATLGKLRESIDKTPGVSEAERKQFADIAAVEEQYGPVARNIVGLALKGERDQAIDKMNKDCRPLLAKLVQASHAYTDAGVERAKLEAADAQASFHSSRAWMLALSVAAFALAGVLVWVITNAITRPLAIAVKVAQTVAAGDLSSRVEIDSHDETGQLLTALKNMNNCLIRLVGHVRQSSDSIATGSSQIATGNADLSHRTELQASRLQETAASMSQMNTTVSNSADTAREAAALAASASQAAQRGGQVVSKVIATMGDISQSSKKIAEIIGVIDGIAFQTNILALNAAVEAARAGDQGRGFAVVAGEVRSLAQRSAGAAREIRGLIGSSVDRVEDGSKLVDETGAAMEDIVSQVRRVSSLISEISSATLGQTSDIGAVNGAVSELDQMTQQNAALVEQSAAAAESLRTQASQLSTLVGQFKLD